MNKATGTKTGAAASTGKKTVSAFDALAKINPALAAALSGTGADVLNRTAAHVESAAVIDKPCDITARVTKFRVTDSFTADEQGNAKEVKPEWYDSTPQVVVTLSDVNAPQFKTHFFNLKGYMTYEEMEAALSGTGMKPEDLNIRKAEGSNYALQQKGDELYRIVSESKTEDALEIFSRFATAIGFDGLTPLEMEEKFAELVEAKANPELIVKFKWGKTYINKDGEEARQVEPVKFLPINGYNKEDGDEEEGEDQFEETV